MSTPDEHLQTLTTRISVELGRVIDDLQSIVDEAAAAKQHGLADRLRDHMGALKAINSHIDSLTTDVSQVDNSS